MEKEMIEELGRKIPELIELGLTSEIFQAQLGVIKLEAIVTVSIAGVLLLAWAVIAAACITSGVRKEGSFCGDQAGFAAAMSFAVTLLVGICACAMSTYAIQRIANPAWTALKSIIPGA